MTETTTNRSSAVDAYMAALEHPMAPTVQEIRVAILALDARITERIKWNAPSFCRNDDDRLTFNLRHPNRIQLILHRGAKVKDTTDVHFSDDSGLVTWAAPDRGIVTMTSPAEATTHHHDLLALVRRWLDATAT